ncbi:MAG: HAD hydrolase-like protein [Prevotella sp.]|nr:HAD hydrolase-like protein [Prevotella sp.]
MDSSLKCKADIKTIVFDADDTLWDCQSHFEDVTDSCCELLRPYADAAAVRASLFRTEEANMPDYGYGTKAFTLSLVENAIRVSGNRIGGDEVRQLLDMGRQLLHMPATPLPGVVDTLQRLSEHYTLFLFTKGELLDQQNKLRRSHLKRFFRDVRIVSDKTVREYERSGFFARPDQTLMVGNSFKSDIQPALTIGAWAAYIPFYVTWQLEQTATFQHPRLYHLEHFGQLTDLLL